MSELLGRIVRFFRPFGVANAIALVSTVAAIFAAKEAWDAAVFEHTAVLVNVCEARFHHHGAFPRWVGVLGRSSTYTIPISEIPVYSAKGERFRPPDYYVDCRLENYGRVPAVNVTYHIRFGVGTRPKLSNDLLVEAPAIPADGGSFEYAIMKGVQDPISLQYTNDAEFPEIGSTKASPHFVSVQQRLDSIEIEFMPPGPHWKQ